MTQEELKQFLFYSDIISRFTWLVSTNKRIKIGDIAGCDRGDGYRQMKINGNKYLEHRLVWLYHYGYMPTKGIDHINGDKSDNRIANLREATDSQNSQNRGIHKNNKTGFMGVTFHKPSGKWAAGIMKNGKKYHLGYYDTPEEARDAYLKAKSELHTFNPTQR